MSTTADTITINDLTLTVESHTRTRRFESARQYDAMQRVYVSCPDPEDLGQMSHPGYGSSRGDGSDQDKAWKRYNRQEVQNMKAALEAAFPGLDARFGRKAGCSCGCSPGFVVQGFVSSDVLPRHADAWVTAKLPDPATDFDGATVEMVDGELVRSFA